MSMIAVLPFGKKAAAQPLPGIALGSTELGRRNSPGLWGIMRGVPCGA